MDLDRLKTLVTLADQGSIAAAARALQAGETTLRKRIAELEAEVGAPLVHRAGRGLELTAAGSALVVDARRLIADSRAALNRVRNAPGVVVGEYRVAVPKSHEFKLSVSCRSKTDPATAYRLHVHDKKLQSVGVWAVTVEECDVCDLAAFEDPVEASEQPWAVADPAHAYIDFESLSNAQRKKKA